MTDAHTLADSDSYNGPVDAVKETHDWPQYFVTGIEEAELVETFAVAYWCVEGPNGPVTYRNPNSDPYPSTMMSLVLDSQTLSCYAVEQDETPWSLTNTDDFEDGDSDG